ncbi:hypothetical protein TeGR_g15299, partial [Tetraparma gracilis]
LTTIQDLEPGNREAKEAMAAIVSGRSSANVVLGELRSSYRVQVLSDNVCRVTLVGQSVPKGWVPKLAMEYGTKYFLGFMKHELQDQYERGEADVDEELRALFPPPPPLEGLDDEQQSVAQRCLQLEAESVAVTWTPLKRVSPFVSTWANYKPPQLGGRTAVALGKAESEIDCSAHEALAHKFHVTSRVNRRYAKENGDLARVVLDRRTDHDFIWAMVTKLPFPLRPREFVGRNICFKDSTGDLVVVFEPSEAEADYGVKLRAVRAEAFAVLRFTPVRDDRCKVTVVKKVDAAGNIPVFVVNRKIPTSISDCAILREEYQRDNEIDKVQRDVFAGVIEHEEQVYDETEEEFIANVQDKLGGLKEEDFKELESPDHL